MRFHYTSVTKKYELIIVVIIWMVVSFGMASRSYHELITTILATIILLIFIIGFIYSLKHIVKLLYINDDKVIIKLFGGKTISCNLNEVEFKTKIRTKFMIWAIDVGCVFFNMRQDLVTLKINGKTYLISNRDDCAKELISFLSESKLLELPPQ